MAGPLYLRKVLELPLSLWFDLILPKRRIMEIYLNVAQWGPNGEFGAEAGSRRAFNKAGERSERAGGGPAGRDAAQSADSAMRASPDRLCAGWPACIRRAPRRAQLDECVRVRR